METRLEFQSYLTWLIGTSQYNAVLQTYNGLTLTSWHIKSLVSWNEIIYSKAIVTNITGLIHILAHMVWWWDTLHILFGIDGGFQFYRTIIHMPCIYFSKNSVCCVWSNIYELSWQTVWCTHSSSYFCVYCHSCFASCVINDNITLSWVCRNRWIHRSICHSLYIYRISFHLNLFQARKHSIIQIQAGMVIKVTKFYLKKGMCIVYPT